MTVDPSMLPSGQVAAANGPRDLAVDPATTAGLYAADPAGLQTVRPSTLHRPPVQPVPLTQGFTEYLAEGGFPDLGEAGNTFAAGQRATARRTENRVASSGPIPAAPAGAVTPAPPGVAPPRLGVRPFPPADQQQ